MNTTTGKQTLADNTQKLIIGANKHLATTPAIPLNGHSYTPAEAIAQLQALVTLRSDVATAKAVTKAKMALEKSQSTGLLVFRKAFVGYVRAAFGTTPDVLADFGLKQAKPRVATVQAKTAAAAKRAATRTARHTMGTVQKRAVKGDVTGVIVTPVTAPKPNAPSAPANTSVPVNPGSGVGAGAAGVTAPATTAGAGSAVLPIPAAPAGTPVMLVAALPAPSAQAVVAHSAV